jgi:hypothetical protein
LLVLLWGDAETTWDGRPDRVPTSVFSDPGGWSDPVTSDNVYVDLDGDDLPDAAVGRVPVRTPAEAEAYVDAVLAYETVWEPGPWNRRLNVFAGIGGFGDLVEDIFLDVGMRIMGELDPAWQVTFVYARQDSPYTWPPPRFSDRVYAYLNAGGLMMSYIGHGSPRGFDTVEWEGGPSGPIFDAARLDDIGIVGRAPVLVFVACSTGSFDTGDCISERILRQPRSSPAILSSTEVSHPYSNTVFIREVERVGFSERPATVGELFLRAKRATAENRDELRDYIDGLASLQMTVEEMEALGPAHLHMYTLFGDPGLRPAWPAGEADVRLDRTWAVRGEPLRVCVQVHGPPSGTARVGFEIQRTDLARWPEPWTLSDPDWEATVTANHESANDKVDWSTEIPYAGGGFELSFVVPATVRARFHHLVVQAGDDASEAIGSTLVRLRPD